MPYCLAISTTVSFPSLPLERISSRISFLIGGLYMLVSLHSPPSLGGTGQCREVGQAVTGLIKRYRERGVRDVRTEARSPRGRKARILLLGNICQHAIIRMERV